MKYANKPEYGYMFFYGTLMNRVPGQLPNHGITTSEWIMTHSRSGFPRTSHPVIFPDLPCGKIMGALCEIHNSDYEKIRKELDYYEGYPSFYNRVNVEVEHEQGTFLAEMYFSVDAQYSIENGATICKPDHNGVIFWRS